MASFGVSRIHRHIVSNSSIRCLSSIVTGGTKLGSSLNRPEKIFRQPSTSTLPFASFSSSTAESTTKSLTQLIKELRSSTGAPMVECKRAISAEGVNGDIEKAMEWLRKHGSAKVASKVSGREATEGLVGLAISSCGDGAALIKVGSETDFASRSEAFSKLVDDVANAALSLPENDSENLLEKLLDVSIISENEKKKSVKDSMEDTILAIRENVQLKDAVLFPVKKEGNFIFGYVHGKAPNSKCAGTAAAVVELVGETPSLTKEEMETVGKKLAMHVVAAKPKYLSPNDIPDDIISKEKHILKEQIQDTKKPPEIIEKIVNGKLRKFYEEVCLTEQGHMLEEKHPKVSKYLKDLSLEVKSYKYFAI